MPGGRRDCHLKGAHDPGTLLYRVPLYLTDEGRSFCGSCAFARCPEFGQNHHVQDALCQILPMKLGLARLFGKEPAL